VQKVGCYRVAVLYIVVVVVVVVVVLVVSVSIMSPPSIYYILKAQYEVLK
jgi:hypothetical protein